MKTNTIISRPPSPHEVLVERCLALAAPVQNPGGHRRYLLTLNDRQLDERALVLRRDQQLRLEDAKPRWAAGTRNSGRRPHSADGQQNKPMFARGGDRDIRPLVT